MWTRGGSLLRNLMAFPIRLGVQLLVSLPITIFRFFKVALMIEQFLLRVAESMLQEDGEHAYHRK
jgi:hypothetical protein